ncbi:MAG TPA: hypothetical protein VE338_05945 [Ktedonobacterales bacterium]|nr:hypothetical protein [Ktedonobacterales bacterium]
MPQTRQTTRQTTRQRAHDADIATVLAALKQVPRAALPGDARAALTREIRRGVVDGLYRPMGSDRYNVTIAELPPYIDPRVPLDQWVAWWRAYIDATDALLNAWWARHPRNPANQPSTTKMSRMPPDTTPDATTDVTTDAMGGGQGA